MERLENRESLLEINQEIKKLKGMKRKVIFKNGLYGIALAGIIMSSLVGLPVTVTALGVCLGHSPFKLEDTTKEAHIRTEFNTDEGRNVSKQYESYDDEKSIVHYHSGWTNTGNEYVSKVVTYDVNGLTYDEVKEGIKSENVEDILGKPILTEEISKDTITEEEQNENSHYEGVIYTIDQSDTIVGPQSEKENGNELALLTVGPALIGLVPGYIFARTFIDSRAGNYLLDHALSFDGETINSEINYYKEKKKKLVKKL